MADSVRAYGAVNEYICTRCGWKAITVDLHEGTTSFIIRCEAANCGGEAHSLFYRVDQNQQPTHEWYRPLSTSERKALKNEAVKQHVEMGGLLLRKRKVH